MHHKGYSNRLNLIAEQLQQETPGFCVIKQYPGESYENLQYRAELLNKENIDKYGHEILIITIRTFTDQEAHNDPK